MYLASELTSAVLTDTVTASTINAQAFTFDAAGNRTGVQTGNTVATEASNNLNQLTATTGGGPMRFAGTVSKPASVTVGGNAATVRADGSYEGWAAVAGMGTTTLFAALDVASGQIISRCKPGHRHTEFISFLRQIDASTPPELDLHVIVDNYATHKHPKVKVWLSRHPRFHFHFTPTYSSWLNQVEIFFGLITRQAIRRGSFASVKDLIQKIDAFVAVYNRTAKPFAWTATAESIFLKLERLLSCILRTQH